MPTLIVENVPPEVYERLQERAAARQRTLPQELLALLQRALREDDIPTPRLPDLIPGDEVLAPYDLPRSSRPVEITCYDGSPRLPTLSRMAGRGNA